MLRHLDLLALSNSNIRICALFINETCKANELDQNNLYYINTDHFYYKSRPLKEIANNRAKQMSTMYDQQKRYYRYGPTFKDGGCNHITCRCGCHWCYKCGEGFKTDTECYDHLYRVHGGCFD